MEENQKLVESNQDSLAFGEQIEVRRKELLNYYKKSKTLSTINIAIVLVLVIGSFVLFVQETLWMKITGGSILGACVIYMLVHYLLTRKILPSKVKDYIAFIANSFVKHDFEEPDFKDITNDVEAKIDQGDILADYVYKDYTNYVSRNVTKGKYKGTDFTMGEVALYANGEKNSRQALFVGKYITYPNTIKCNSRFIYNCRGEKEFDLPNNFDGIVELQESGHIHIYGLEGGEKAPNNTKIINSLKAIQIKSPLLNLNLVIWEGHTAVYLSFDDTVMGIPFEHPFDEASHDKQRDIIKDVFELLESLNK